MEGQNEYSIKSFEEDVMADKPIQFTLKAWVKSKKFWEKKKFVEKQFNVKRLRTWQNIKIQTALAKIILNQKDLTTKTVANLFGEILVNHHSDLIYMTAVCLSEDPTVEPSDELRQLIINATTNEDLKNIWDIMIIQTDAIPFMNGIISAKGTRMTETNPNQ